MTNKIRKDSPEGATVHSQICAVDQWRMNLACLILTYYSYQYRDAELVMLGGTRSQHRCNASEDIFTSRMHSVVFFAMRTKRLSGSSSFSFSAGCFSLMDLISQLRAVNHDLRTAENHRFTQSEFTVRYYFKILLVCIISWFQITQNICHESKKKIVKTQLLSNIPNSFNRNLH